MEDEEPTLGLLDLPPAVLVRVEWRCQAAEQQTAMAAPPCRSHGHPHPSQGCAAA
jgi:hypothetical protein